MTDVVNATDYDRWTEAIYQAWQDNGQKRNIDLQFDVPSCIKSYPQTTILRINDMESIVVQLVSISEYGLPRLGKYARVKGTCGRVREVWQEPRDIEWNPSMDAATRNEVD